MCPQIKASTTSSLDICPDFTESVVGQASYVFHISQKLQPYVVCICVEWLKLRWGGFLKIQKWSIVLSAGSP